VKGNVRVMSEMLNELKPGQSQTDDIELLQVRVCVHVTIICTIYHDLGCVLKYFVFSFTDDATASKVCVYIYLLFTDQPQHEKLLPSEVNYFAFGTMQCSAEKA